MAQFSDSFRLFHHVRDTAYSPTNHEHPGLIDLDEEAVAATLGISADEARHAVDDLVASHLLKRAAHDDETDHDEVHVLAIDDLSAFTVLLASN